MSDQKFAFVSPEVIEAAMARAHMMRSQALADGFAALTGRKTKKDDERA